VLFEDSGIETYEHNSTKVGVKEAQGYFLIPLRLFMVGCRADQRRARVPKMACGNNSLALAIHSCNNFLFILPQPAPEEAVVATPH
jgi:hypothetical protein